jgi:glycosyltransferase involved in cell wall biosynthesis
VPHHPLVSVCIPTWNRAAILTDAIVSALNQEGVDLEVVVGDNASDDDTVAVVEKLAAADNRVRLNRNDANYGCYPNCAELLRVALGTHIKFLMSDDVLRPGALARMVPQLDDPKVKLVSSGLNFVDPNLQPVEQPWWTAPPVPTDARIPGVMFGDHCLVNAKNFAHCPSNVMFRRSDVVPEDFARFNGVFWFYSGDFATWLSLMARGDVVYLVDPAADLRLHPGQGSVYQGNGPLAHIEWLYLVAMSKGFGFLIDSEARRVALLQAMRNLIATVDLSSGDAWGPESLKALAFGLRLLAATARNNHIEELSDPADGQFSDLFRNFALYRELISS